MSYPPEKSNPDGSNKTELKKEQTAELFQQSIQPFLINYYSLELSLDQELELDLMDLHSPESLLTKQNNTFCKIELMLSELPTDT